MNGISLALASVLFALVAVAVTVHFATSLIGVLP